MISNIDTILIIILIIFATSLILSLISLLVSLRTNKKLKLLLTSLRSKLIRSYIKSIEKRMTKRLRRRYLVFEVVVGNIESKEVFDRLIKEYFKELFGSLELSRSGITLVLIDSKSGRGILRFNSAYRSKVLMTLALLQLRKRIIINPLRTTGTLKKAIAYSGIRKR